MSAPRAADWRMDGRTDGRSWTDRALRVILTIGMVVFCLAVAALARGSSTVTAWMTWRCSGERGHWSPVRWP